MERVNSLRRQKMSRIKIGLFLVIVVFVLSGCATTFINRGDRFLELEQYEKATDSYTRALGFGESAIAYRNRGVAYCYLEKYERAIEDYNRAIKLEPKWRVIYVLRGLAYAAMKKYRAAIKDHNRAIELDPDQALPYHCRGLAYRDMKQYERAMQDFDVALEIEEKAVFYADKAVTLYWMGKSEESKRVYRMAIQLDDRWAGKFEELKKEGFMFRPEEYTAVKELWRMVETGEIGYLAGKERPEQPEQETYAETLYGEEERLCQETSSQYYAQGQIADEEPAGEPRTGRWHYQATEEPEPTPEPEYQRDLLAKEEKILYDQLKKKVRKAETYSEALDIFRDYLSKYPSSIYRDEIEKQIKIREIKIAKRKAVEMDFYDVRSIFSEQQYKYTEFEQRRKRDQLRGKLIYSKKEAREKSCFSLGKYDFDLRQFRGRIGYQPEEYTQYLVQSEIREFVSPDGSTFNFILEVDEKDGESLRTSDKYLHIIYTPLKVTSYLSFFSSPSFGNYRSELFCLYIDLEYAWLTIKGSNKIFPLEIVQ